MGSKYDSSMLNDFLPVYYKRLFPYKSYIQWISGGNFDKENKTPDKNYISKREFSFTLEDDIYLRYMSFSSADELKAEMLKKIPHKIDIGAVFNAKPSDHKKIANFQPQEKELVFDIDLTDYDDVRTCCQGAAICNNCWRFMIIAVKILNRALRTDFGFKNLLWVYSGRRGIHCWVSDKTARQLGQTGRSAVAEYLQVLTGGDAKAKKINLSSNGVHPSIGYALKIIKEEFKELCIKGQDILGNQELWQKVLVLIPEEKIRTKLHSDFATLKDSEERWSRLVSHTNERTQDEIMLQFAYPRLDINVTKGLNHLLKSPFCIHPKTGRVCIPFNADKVDDFRPENVPTVNQLVDELDKSSKDENNASNVEDYDKTSLKGPMKVFESFLRDLQ